MAGRRFAQCVLAGIVIVGAAIVPATIAGGAPAPYSGLLGTWTDAATTGIMKLVISPAGAGIKVDAFSKCAGPKLCESGKVSAVVFGGSVAAATGRSFRANQAFPTYNRVMLGQLVSTAGGPHLNVEWYLTFKDGTRYNSWLSRAFKRVGAATSSPLNGTASATYPSGRQPHAPDSFLGTWNNTNAATDGVVKYVITRQENGSLLIHEYGACSPALCDLGTATSIAFSASSTSATANRFLSASTYSFDNELRVGSLAAGVLTVTMWDQFTDGSGRSNFRVTETFKH